MLLPIKIFLVAGFLVDGQSTPTKSYPVPNPLNGTCQYDGLAMADPYDPMIFYQCCKYMWFFQTCNDGMVFDKIKLACVPSSGSSQKLAVNQKVF
ncbi:Chitin-binding type-2 domain-containing protein [Caenorhabditis elegans]|uniref:Chitin-binding type-2 domain-containing protein n=1 Tax=Caenorhabditis elegans TaxID=6239 RepID=E3WIS3_CAEEL|nr:Chitin-binding type-2 domain-containing protein [Caenorhabditis elegans]CCD71730.2 Chitin-binding type-2 domain-containing protein [Caenorhabditis elegans]|eukprot:NP_001248789.2 Uncharacterized protein CELE_Y48G1C.13 [Caenorhabditis elegans]